MSDLAYCVGYQHGVRLIKKDGRTVKSVCPAAKYQSDIIAKLGSKRREAKTHFLPTGEVFVQRLFPTKQGQKSRVRRLGGLLMR